MNTPTEMTELAPATISEADGVRYLHLGTPWVQGAMRTKEPLTIELEYVRRMMAWMLLHPLHGLRHGHAVQLGLGAAAITRFCWGALQMKTTAVEINDSVIAACRMWFCLLPDGERLRVLHADAAAFAADLAHAGTVQALCVDLYDHDAASPVLDSEDFYRDCHRLLADGGTMSVNLFGRDASFERSAQRIAAAFAGGQVVTMQPTREGNTVVIALKGRTLPDRDTLAARAEAIETRYQLPAKKWLRMVRAWPPAGKTARAAAAPTASAAPDDAEP